MVSSTALHLTKLVRKKTNLGLHLLRNHVELHSLSMGNATMKNGKIEIV